MDNTGTSTHEERRKEEEIKSSGKYRNIDSRRKSQRRRNKEHAVGNAGTSTHKERVKEEEIKSMQWGMREHRLTKKEGKKKR